MSLPYFPLYPTDFEADTSHLTLEEDGAYNRLLRLMWMTPGCSLPDDKAWLMRRMRVDSDAMERVVWPVIDEFMTRKSGRIFSPRLVVEFKKADETSKRRSDAGKRGGRPQATEKPKKEKKAGFVSEKAGLFDTRALPEPYPEPEPYPDSSEDLATLDLRVSQQESSSQFALTLKEEGSAREEIDAEFEKVWQHYPRKVGKGAAKAKWRMARRKESKDVIGASLWAHIRVWAAGTPVDKIPHLATWLHQERWNDEPTAAANRRQTSDDQLNGLMSKPDPLASLKDLYAQPKEIQ